jgi:predicted ATPase
MLSRLRVKNFAVFENADFSFSPGLNIILGENGTGKSLLMKLAYSCAWTSAAIGKGDRKTKDEIQKSLADKIKNVCLPDSLGRLVTRKPGRARCEVGIDFAPDLNEGFAFSFATNSDKEVKLEGSVPSAWLGASPVFLPTKEVLSIFPNFASTLRERHLSFDETYLDLADTVGLAALKKLRKEEQSLRESLERIMGGKVFMENNRFYLYSETEGKGKIEMPLVAEGIRKIALLTYLVMNGGLRDKSLLFWDEPEVNLNPKLMRQLAKTLVEMAEQGVQIVIATHSLFLLRELEIAKTSSKAKRHVRYFALSIVKDELTISQGDSIEEIDPIASLDADLEQSDRYLELP